jgi:cytochrome c-type biogenesis protein
MFAIGLAFVAGLLTILNPCVLPLAPIVVAGAAARDPRGPFALALGLALTFGIVGGLIASAGAELGDNAVLRWVSALVMIALGLAIALPVVSHAGEQLLAPLVTLGHRLSAGVTGAGLWGQAGLGALLALLWGPCVGPTLGAALVLAAGTGTLLLAMTTMAVFALGAAVSLLLAGFVVGQLTRQSKAATRNSARIGRTIFGGVLVVVALAALTGFDRILEASLVQIMPDWLVLFATQV